MKKQTLIYLSIILINILLSCTSNVSDNKNNLTYEFTNNINLLNQDSINLEKSLSEFWIDFNQYSSFLKYFTANNEHPINSTEISIDIDSAKSMIFGYLSSEDNGRLIIANNGTYLVLRKIEDKILDNNNQFNQRVIYQSESELSTFKKVIINYEDPTKCGALLQILVLDKSERILLKKSGGSTILRFCN